MANLLPENEIIEFENQQYLNPQVALDESTAFIDNLRNVQDRNNAEINAQTRNLGTEVPSNLGGLVGGSGYWTSRLQTPQSVSLAANLRATAQAQALNDVLQNELSAQKQRYNNAYKAARQRAMRRGGGGGGGNPSNPGGTKGGVEENIIDEEQFDVKQDINEYGYIPDVYNSTEVAHDNRSTERDKKIEVTRFGNGNIRTVKINGVTHTGRDAQAKYRYLKNAGLVR